MPKLKLYKDYGTHKKGDVIEVGMREYANRAAFRIPGHPLEEKADLTPKAVLPKAAPSTDS